MRVWLLLSVLAALAVGCGSQKESVAAKQSAQVRTGPASWPAPADPIALTLKAGLKPEKHEFFAYHVHAHLDVLVNGQAIAVPAGIGIDITDPGVQHGVAPDGTPTYGGIEECDRPCISPLHTHDDTGVLHTESQHAHPNRLGQFFTEWNVRLTRTCVGGYCKRVRFYVDGKRYLGDTRAITLTDLKEIAIVTGSPPASIPSRFPS